MSLIQANINICRGTQNSRINVEYGVGSSRVPENLKYITDFVANRVLDTYIQQLISNLEFTLADIVIEIIDSSRNNLD